MKEKDDEQKEKRDEVKWLDFRNKVNQVAKSTIYKAYHFA